MNIIILEEDRYAKTIDKGNRIVKRTIKNLKKQNKDLLPVETLIDLYDAHGMPPETVKEITEGVYDESEFKVNIPDNFFTLVANQHTEEEIISDSELKLDYPPTDLLFYDNFHISNFEAEILDIIEKKYNKKYNNEDNKEDNNKNNKEDNNLNIDEKNQFSIILDQTAFYPEGGGQPSDIGYLTIKGKKIEVIHAEKVGDVVLHNVLVDEDIDYFKNDLDIIGEKINGKINWERRISLARNHTATHLIIAASKKVLGNHIWQAGAQKGLKRSRIDLSHYKRITQDEIDEIEKIANDLVMDNIILDINWMNREKLKKIWFYSLSRGSSTRFCNKSY